MVQKKDWHRIEFLTPITESVSHKGDFLIKGTAINETTTRNNVRYVGEELQKSAHSLRNKPILKDHVNSVDMIVGRTTQNVFYNVSERKVDFEAKIVDKAIQEKIREGLIQSVSIGAVVEDLEESANENDHFVIAKGIDFVELSLVAVPADPNAGFAKACMESFELKKVDVQESAPVVEDKIILEENTMSEDIEKIKQEKAALEEELKKFREEKAKAEEEKRIQEEVAKRLEEAKKAEEAKVLEAKKTENKTKGELPVQTAKEDYKDLVIGKDGTEQYYTMASFKGKLDPKY